MTNWKIIVGRVITGIVFLVGGAAIQIGLWKTVDRTYFEALTKHSYLWVIYLLLSLIIGEYFLRLMKLKR